jgi:hypothetical protein
MLKTLSLNLEKCRTLPLRSKLPFKQQQQNTTKPTEKMANSKNDCLMETSVQEILNSLSYLNKVIKNEKFEIIQNSLTYLLEAILQFYNCLTSRTFGDAIKSDINSNLARLLKLFDYSYLSMVRAKDLDPNENFIKKTEALDLIKILVFLFDNLLAGADVADQLSASFKRSMSDSNMLDDNRSRYLDIINLKRLFSMNSSKKTSINRTLSSDYDRKRTLDPNQWIDEGLLTNKALRKVADMQVC